MLLRELVLNPVPLVPYSDSDSEDNENIEAQKNNEKGKKRVKNEKTGKRI